MLSPSLSRPRSPSRARRVLRAAAALALLAVPAARAEAQPACAAGTAASYAAEGFSCRIGSWRLYDFHVGTDHSAVGGAAAATADPLAVVLTPFLATSAAGRTTFGFDFDGLTTSVDGQDAAEATVFAQAFIGFDFYLESLDPGVALAGGRVVGTQQVVGSARAGDPGGRLETALGAHAGAIYPSPIPNVCLGVREVAATPADRALDETGACETAPPRTAVASVFAWSEVSGGISGSPLAGSAATTITRLELVEATAVPEPATVALFGAGLAVLAGAGAARRRR
jgi:hypothetical protein